MPGTRTHVESGFPPSPKAPARLAEARCARGGGSRPWRALILVLLAASVSTIAASAPRPQSPAPRIIEITAERFEFWPSEVTVMEGEAVVIRLRSDDTLHGFRVLGAGTNVIVPKRGKGSVTATLTGLKPGRYTFECSRLCGAGHNFMRGVLVVRAADGSTP